MSEFVETSAPIHEYQFAYPGPLIEKISQLMLRGMKESEFSLLTPEALSNLEQDSIRKILNDAWTEFWENGNYFDWEKEIIQKLKDE